MLAFMQAPSGGVGGSRRNGSDCHLSAGVLMAKTAAPAAPPSQHERTPQQQQHQQKRQMRRCHSTSMSVYRNAASTIMDMNTNTNALVVSSACASVNNNNTRNPANMAGLVTPMSTKAQESRRTTLATTSSSSLSTVASSVSPSKLLTQQQQRAEPITRRADQPTSARHDTPRLRSHSSFSSSSSSSCLSSSSLVQVLIKHAHKKHQQPRLLTHNRNSSQTQLSTSRSHQQQQQQDELPILRCQYIARDVKVLIGTRWKLKKFKTKTIVLHTSSAKNGSPTLTICAKTPIEADASAIKFTLAMNLTCVHSGPNGLKLKSSSSSSDTNADKFRLKIRFVTPADASIWFNLIHETTAHARWIRDVEETSCLSRDPMATVLVARHVPTDQEFVIKVLPRVRVDDGTCTEILVLKKLFKAAASSVSSSSTAEALRHILEYRVIETSRDVRIVMPKFPGKNLLQFLQQQKPKNQPNQQQHTLSESDARSVLLGLCEALYALHAAGIVHCDLKLENILLTDVSNVRVIDFGGAYDISSSITTKTSQGGPRLKHKIKAKSQRTVIPQQQQQHQRVMMVGTPGYIAPERILFVDEPPTPAADVFSAGIVLFQMLTGRQPFTRASRHRALSMQDATVLHWQSAEKILESHGVSSAATQLIERMVESDPRSRITVEELFCHPWLCC